MIGRILLGGIITAIGYLMVLKTEGFAEFFGVIPSAEHYLGAGGTRLGYKLIGVGLCLLGLIIVANLYERVVGGLILAIFS